MSVRAGLSSVVVAVSLVAGLTTKAEAEPLATGTVLREGKAYCVETGRHLYTEHHVQRWRGEVLVSSRVAYRAPGGRLLAQKQLAYSDRLQLAPAFRFEDLRSGLVEEARWTGERFTLRTREGVGQAFEAAGVEDPAGLVVDAGFDNAVRAHWDSLARGTELTFRFAVPARLDWYTLAVEKVAVVERGGRRLLELRMEPASALLSLIADEVSLLYDVEGRYLVEYRGLSNLRTDHGETQDVRIVFDAPRRSGS